ncbi:hypothetical protein C478_07092 [Natrinema thermotolerans DSM 11552]|nr:hypothetical protein C478_07092 [Natrinema thermotolerans DSM 11552]
MDNDGELEVVVEYTTVKRNGDADYSPRNLPDGGKEQSGTVGTTSKIEIQNRLPSTVTGTVGSGRYAKQTDEFPVRFKEVTVSEDWEYKHNYDPIPGGCHVGDGGNIATVTTPAYYDWSETYGWVHCAHAFGYSGGSDAYQDGDKIGSVGPTTSEGQGDACFIEEELSGSIGANADYDIAKDSPDSSMGWNIMGSVAEDRLLDMLAHGDTFDFQGCNSGRQIYSDIQRVSDTNFAENCRVVIDAPSRGGDSGGPYYYDGSGDGDIYIGAVNRGHADFDDDGDTDAVGYALHWVEDYLNVRV